MPAPRQEIAAEFTRLVEELPGGRLPETFSNEKRRQAFMKENRQALAVLGIRTDRELQDVHNESQKGSFRRWIDEYVYSPSHPIVGTLWKLGTAKPIEGVVNAIPIVNKIPLLGKIARWATVGAVTGWLLNLFREGMAGVGVERINAAFNAARPSGRISTAPNPPISPYSPDAGAIGGPREI